MSYVNSVTVYPSSATITKGKWYYGAYASIASDCPECAEVEWYSNSPAIASVNKTTGYIYGVNTGTTRIYAEATDGSGKKDYITVTVTAPVAVTGVSVCPTSLTMDVGCTDYLYETIHPSNATNQTVTWCSSDESVATVNTYTGKVTAKKAGIATITACTVDGGYSDSCEVWVHGKTPVFLIHGRTSNSFDVWGAGNRIFTDPLNPDTKDNNHYNSSINALSEGNVRYLYTNKSVQDIFGYNTGLPMVVKEKEDSEGETQQNFFVPAVFNGQFKDGEYIQEHPEGGNLAYYLKSNGYKENINLFVFNYPNEDAVVHSAKKFEAYIENLISYVRTSGTNEMKACFYASRCDYILENHKINLVGHSMGGLVARYFIENLYQDTHVDKLITICTPHWGSPLAELSNDIGILHLLCDHDLDVNSAMYGGSNSTTVNCNKGSCPGSNYTVTPTLQYQRQRSTKYYAIAGINYDSDGMSDNNFDFELQNNSENLAELNTEIIQRSQNKLYALTNMDGVEMRVQFNAAYVRDNVVGFLSQIGWGSLNETSFPTKKINFKKILVNIDTDGGNSLTSHFHSKMPHRIDVINKVIEYLEE